MDGRLDRARQHAPLRRVQRARRSRGRGDRLRERQAADDGRAQPDPPGPGDAGGRRPPARRGNPAAEATVGWLSSSPTPTARSTASRGRRCTTRARWRCSSTPRSCAASRPSSPSRPRGAGRAGPRPSTCTGAWGWRPTPASHGARRRRLLGPRHRSDRGAVIAVVGSINLDLVVAVERHPAPGETVVGGDCRQLPGGKGANQAVAAARLGARWPWSAASAPTRRAHGCARACGPRASTSSTSARIARPPPASR